MSNDETKYRKAYTKLNSIARKNSNCRSDKGLVACAACPQYKTCKCNDYDDQLEQVKKYGACLDARTKLKIQESLR